LIYGLDDNEILLRINNLEDKFDAHAQTYTMDLLQYAWELFSKANPTFTKEQLLDYNLDIDEMTLSGTTLMASRKKENTKWHTKKDKPFCGAPETPDLEPPACIPTEAVEPAPAEKVDAIVKPENAPIESFVIALDPQAIRAFKITYKNVKLAAQLDALKKADGKKKEEPAKAPEMSDF